MTPRRWRVVSIIGGVTACFFSSLTLLTRHAHQLYAGVIDEVVWTPSIAGGTSSENTEEAGKTPDFRVDAGKSENSAGTSSFSSLITRATSSVGENSTEASLHPLDRVKVPFPIFVASLDWQAHVRSPPLKLWIYLSEQRFRSHSFQSSRE